MLLAGKLDKEAVIVGGHSLEVDVDRAVGGYVRTSSHSPAAGTDLHAPARLGFRQDQKMTAFGRGLGRYGGGGTVAAVAEVEDGEVESLTGADGDSQR